MSREELDTMRLAICISYVICNGLGLPRPETMPSDDDVYEQLRWCAGYWERLMAADQSHPVVIEHVQMFRQPVPSPTGIENLREFLAVYDTLTYENVKTWWNRKQDGIALEDYLRERNATEKATTAH